MKGWIALSALLCTVALMAVAAVSASARVPNGQGLVSFGVADCGPQLGVVEIFGPPAGPAASGYLIDTTGTDPHVVATRFELTSPGGEVLFSKSFGNKTGLTTVTCTQTLPLGDVFTLTAALVPRG